MTTRSTASSAADDEPVAGGVRLGQELDVAGVQEIETAIGEADAQAPPFGEPLVEHRPVEDDLLFGGERGGGENARAQLRRRHSCGAALADHHRGRRIGRAHRGLIVHLGREHHRKRGNHGIARTRSVSELDRVGRHVERRTVCRHQDQAGIAERNDNGVRPQQAIQFRRCRDHVVVGIRAPARCFREFLTVRLDHRCAAINGVVDRFGVNDDRYFCLFRRIDNVSDDPRRQRAFGIVGQDDARRTRQCRQGAIDQGLLGLGIERLRQFPVGAQQMGRMMLGNEANLARGRTRRIDDEMRFDQRLGGERAHQRAASVILTDNTEENAARTERRNVARHVAGATDGKIVAGHRENRSRRLGRDARNLAVDEVVEHQISNADNGLLGNELERVFEIEHGADR
jgi:hypothetical protein